MPESLEFFGVLAASLITGIHNGTLKRRLGERDAMRLGVKDGTRLLRHRPAKKKRLLLPQFTVTLSIHLFRRESKPLN